MMRSLYSAVSGLKTHQTRMDVIGNNIANVNTEAFKSSSVTFSEIMYQTVSGASAGNGATGTGGVNAKQIGLGVSTGSTTVSIETAGAAETTGNPFDLKLTDSQTTNFFIVSDGTNTMFTRAGSFYVDGNGYLCMSSTGYTLMGWQVDPTTGEIRKDTVSALQVMSPGNQTSQPEATQKAYVSGVLDKNDPNLSNEEGYVLALNFFDSLGYGYTGKFKVTPALNEAGEVKNPGEYHIELTDILNQDGTSILKDPSDPTGETFLPNMDPGRLFSTGEVETVKEKTTQYAYDAAGNRFTIYNLGTEISPMLYTKDTYGNVYNVQKNGSSYLSEQSADNMAYRLVKDKDGVISYVLPTQIQDVEISADNKTGKTANGATVYSNDGGTSLYKFGDDGKIYKVEQHSVTHEYVTKEDVASLYKLADGTQKYVWNTDSFTDLGTPVAAGTGEVFEAGYTFYKVGDEFYAEKDGVVYKTVSTPSYTDTPNGTYSVVGSEINPFDPTIVDISSASPRSETSTEGYTLYDGTDGNIYAYDNGKFYLAQENTSPALTSTTYNADTANIAYYAVTEQGDTTDTVKYIEPDKLFTKDASFVDMQVTTGGVPVYYNKDKDEYYAVDENNDIYLVDTTSDPNKWTFDPDTPLYVKYTDGQNARVYIKNGETLMPEEDLDFSTPYSVEKETQQYKPYTIVYDQNNGKFVSCGVDNLAEGSSLSLQLSDILINHKINDDAENEADKSTSIYLSEDGFTQSNFSNIEIDFSKSMNYNNSGTSTMKALKGDTKGDGTGKQLGALTGLTVDNSGKIYGSYDNGNTVLLCQIACAQFANASGLEKVGENCYATTLNSGEFDGIGVEVDADGSSISTGELEMSNVDLSAEFTSMIITQRGFQANSRIITTSDTLLEELINLKR